MTETEPTGDEIRIGEFFKPLSAYWRVIALVTTAATALVLIIGGVYLWQWQPTRWEVSVPFTPLFINGYPNGTGFSSTEVVDRSVLDEVYDTNHLETYCSREEFLGGFFVEATSVELAIIDREYQARLADTRLSAVDRERVQSEYRAKRQSAPISYRLAWIRSPACARLPPALGAKILPDVLTTWADNAVNKRNVLQQVALLTPAIFAPMKEIQNQPLLNRADMIRSSIDRVVSQLQRIETFSGANAVRMPKSGVTFIQLRQRLQDLMQGYVDPLMIQVAHIGRTEESLQWIQHVYDHTDAERKSAEDRANAYEKALREYSGVQISAPAAGADRSKSGEAQGLTMQLDRSLFEQLFQLGSVNAAYRLELTRSMVAARLTVVDFATSVEFYKRLLDTLQRGRGNGALTADEAEQRLTAIAREAADLLAQANELFNEFSRSSLLPGTLLYRLEAPPVATTVRSFALRDYALVVLETVILTPVVAAIVALVHYRVRRRRTA